MFIYGLYSSAELGVIRYVGQTQNEIRLRLADHIKRALAGNKSHKDSWIRKTLDEGQFVLSMFLALASSNDEADELERHYIAKLRAEGVRLTNNAEGGRVNRGHKHSVEARRNMSLSHLGKSNSHVGVPKTEETKAQISAAIHELMKAPEWYQAVSEGVKRANAEGRRKSTLGSKQSPEATTKRLASLAVTIAKRRALTPKRVIPKIGSEEDRANRREAQQARREREIVAGIDRRSAYKARRAEAALRLVEKAG